MSSIHTQSGMSLNICRMSPVSASCVRRSGLHEACNVSAKETFQDG